MKTINYFSTWATRYPRQAVPLIIILEFFNVAIGITVGSALFQAFPPWVFMILVVGIVFTRVIFKKYAHIRLFDLTSHARFRFQKQVFSVLFCINLCVYTLAGGILGHIVAYPEATSNLYGSMSTVSETSSKDSPLSFREKMYQKSIKRTATREGDAGRRAGYIGLFILGIVLSIFGAYLACGIACSGYGFAAVLVLLLSTGVLAGGIYFLGRVIDKNMKPYKEMTRDERKREKRRYLRTLLGTVGGMALLLLISSLTN